MIRLIWTNNQVEWSVIVVAFTVHVMDYSLGREFLSQSLLCKDYMLELLLAVDLEKLVPVPCYCAFSIQTFYCVKSSELLLPVIMYLTQTNPSLWIGTSLNCAGFTNMSILFCV
jgi:hypothetical protein